VSEVTVVIPTWKRAPWLARCLAAVLVQEPRPQEVVVVGRAEDLDAQEVVRRAVRPPGAVPVRWLEVDRPGHIAPIEVGLRATVTPLVAFLDDDAEPEPGWLGALVSALSDTQIACVGGRVITPGFRGKVHPDAGRIRWYGKQIGNIGALEAPGPLEVDGVMECNWAWRTGVMRQIQLDPIFEYGDAAMYGLDLCLQAKALGYRVLYQPAARVVHHIAPRDPALNRQDRPQHTFTYSRNYTYLAMKHLPGWRRAAFALWWWLVGERGSYGIATAAMDMIMSAREVWPLLKVSFAGKRAGVRAWAENARQR
jgi:glycogen(starch) synthase